METLLIPGAGIVEIEAGETLNIPSAGLVEIEAEEPSFNPAWAINSNQVIQ